MKTKCLSIVLIVLLLFSCITLADEVISIDQEKRIIYISDAYWHALNVPYKEYILKETSKKLPSGSFPWEIRGLYSNENFGKIYGYEKIKVR